MVVDPTVLFRRSHEKNLPSTTASILGVLKSMHDICQELVFVIHSHVRELELANKKLICMLVIFLPPFCLFH